ncbi:MAG: PKD domain-containing protein [Anaerotruncus sp.]|nr:PKD domain-containing protein [Anaerotruncus sp.]
MAALAVSFTYSPGSPAVNQAVQFTDTSAGSSSTSWCWNFGDGADQLRAQNPSHAFATAGSRTVISPTRDRRAPGSLSGQPDRDGRGGVLCRRLRSRTAPARPPAGQADPVHRTPRRARSVVVELELRGRLDQHGSRIPATPTPTAGAQDGHL